MELKIIECLNYKDLEDFVNEFFFLLSWLDKEIFYFKKESENNRHIAIIVFKDMRLEAVEKTYRKLDKEQKLKENPALKSRLDSLYKFYFPKKEAKTN